MAEVVVDLLEPVQIDRDHADRPRALAAQPRQFVLVVRAVVQLGQHVVLAEEFDIGLGLLARGDIGQRYQHLVPFRLMPWEHRPLHVHIDLPAVQRIVDDLALLPQLLVPQVDQLLGEMLLHVVPEHIAQARIQHRLRRRAEHQQRLLVDVDHADFLHAARDKIGMHVQEGPEIGNASGAHLIDQHLDRAEVLDPQRHRRMLEQPDRVLPAVAQFALGTLALRDVVDRQQHAVPKLLVAGQHAAGQLDIETLAVERVIDGLP